MGESLEFELHKKLTRIREELSKREVDVRGQLANIEKIRVEALKKTQELKYSAQHDMEKIDQDILKTKDLNTQIKAKLSAEIATLKEEIETKYAELRKTILGKTDLT
jgi:multidrug resistance efflux pump